MAYKIGNTIRELIYVMDSSGDAVTGLTNVDFTNSLSKDGVLTTEVITITEKALGYYWMEFKPESTGLYTWQVFQATYQPEGWYDEHLVNTYNDDDIKSDTTNIITYALRILGLTQENTYTDTLVYDFNNNPTSARIRLYSVAGSVGTDLNVLATYTVTSTFNVDSECTSYKVVKV